MYFHLLIKFEIPSLLSGLHCFEQHLVLDVGADRLEWIFGVLWMSKNLRRREDYFYYEPKVQKDIL
jgi:hypothetical protein